MINHLLGHNADPDGIICHAIVRRALGNVIHHFADYDGLKEKIEGLLEAEPGNVIVADLALKGMVSDTLFTKLKNRHRTLQWFDHHQESIDKKEFLQKYCDLVKLAPNVCASRLLQQVYAPHDLYLKFLADLAQIHDFERKEHPSAIQAYNLQDIIASGYDNQTLVEDLAREEVWIGDQFTERYKTVVQEFEKKKQRLCALLEESVELRQIAGLNVIVAYSDSLLYMKLAPQHLKKNLSADCFFVLYEGKTNVIVEAGQRIGKTILDFLTLQGGGGRGHGGGFTLNHAVTGHTYLQDKEEVLQRFARYFKHNHISK